MLLFLRNFIIMPTLPRQHWAAIGCTEIGQPIGATVHLYCVDSFENLVQRYVGEGWVVVDKEKSQFFLKTKKPTDRPGHREVTLLQ